MNLINLIYGINNIRIEEIEEKLVKDYLGEVDDFNRIVLDYEETPVEAIVEEAQTLPFLSDKKAVVVKNADAFTATKGKSTVEHNIDLLIKYLENKDDDTLIIFTVHRESVDNRKKVTKVLKANGTVTEVEEMNETELRKYIESEFYKENIEFDSAVIPMIIERTGVHYDTVKRELEKLVLYVENEIKKEHVEEVISKSLEQNVFVLTEYLLKNRKQDAINVFRDLLLQKEEPIKLLGLIASQFRLYYQTKILKQNGLSPDNIARKLKVHPYRVKLAYRFVDGYDLEYLLERMVLIRDMDYAFKSSYLEREALFEVFLTRI